MDMNGEFTVPAAREAVWEALNDPDVLMRCIPGCESITRASDTQFDAAMRMKIGPVKAKFTTTIELSDLNPPVSYTLSGQGKGGAAGFAKGSARVELESVAEGTCVRYTAAMQVGGKLAQIGSRLVAGAARKIADQFFNAFSQELGG
jgi:uncharacterized protein